MKKMKMYSKSILLFSAMLSMMIFVSCEETVEAPPTGDPIASFQFEVDEVDFLKVSFTSFSQNATSFSWDFGGDGVSIEENPTHTFTESGVYSVSLTVENELGVSNTKTESISITDPFAAQRILVGDGSKTWKLFREGTGMYLDPHWPGITNDGSRPCLYMHEFTFNSAGEFIFDDNDVFWGEFGVWDGTDIFETCFEPTAENMTVNGVDVSAWGSGAHAFEYNTTNSTLTLKGKGAWLGIPKLGTDGDHGTTMPEEVTYDVIIVEKDGYDSMGVSLDYGDGGTWKFAYVSYDNPADEPELVTDFVAAPCDGLESISPTELSRTFASDASDQYVLLDTIPSGSGIEYGVDDPADANAAKVGKFIRVEGGTFQELQFQVSPAPRDINFANISTVSIDVYLPSTNTYGELTDKVIIGLGETTCPPNWWEDNMEFSTEAVAKDQWVTLSYNITEPSFVAVTGNGATPKDRNDFDMVYINIGGGGHGVGGEFYIRNLVFE